jgi:uncharacterized protein
MRRDGAYTGLALSLLFALTAGFTAAAVGQAVRQDAFIVTVNGDTLAVENVSRTAAALEGELVGQAIGRTVYRVVSGPDGTAREMTLRAWMPGRTGDDAPAQEARLLFAGDSVLVDVTGAAGSRTERIATRPGAVPYLNLSFALVELVVLRARDAGAATVTVPLFLVQGGQTIDATLSWAGPDSATLTIAGSVLHLQVAPDGTLRGAAVPAQRLGVSRVEGVHAPTPALEPPDYSAPPDAPYTAEHVTITTAAGHTLAGTLTLPQGRERSPAVVMITGSGAQDRDQALPMLRGYRPFRDIADTLSRTGIAVLRLDDRGFGESRGVFASATSADFADDIRAGLAYLRARTDIDGARLGLVGHSEGGLIAPKVAATDTSLAAVVLIAGPARTGRAIIEYQQRYSIERAEAVPPAARDSAYQAARDQLESHAAGSPWLRYFLDYDPLTAASRVRRTSVLILHGETDRQVTVDQADELAAAFRGAGNSDVTVRTFPGINHLLLPDPDGDPGGYVQLPERNVAPEVLGALAEWLGLRLPAGG